MSLAEKYKPISFQDVYSQEFTKSILQNMLTSNNTSHIIILRGDSGSGRSSIANIYVKQLGLEYCLLNSNIMEDLKKAINNIKVFIIKNVSSLSKEEWKELDVYITNYNLIAIFIALPSDNIPSFISNNAMEFILEPNNLKEVESKLIEVCNKEGFNNCRETCEYLASISNGSIGKALNYLEQVAQYNTTLDLQITENILKLPTTAFLLDLTNDLIDNNIKDLLNKITSLRGCMLSNFIDIYVGFLLKLIKYCVFKDFSITQIPVELKNKVDFTVNIENNINYFNWLLNNALRWKSETYNGIELEALFLSLFNGGVVN